jgi:hypothetical protein
MSIQSCRSFLQINQYNNEKRQLYNKLLILRKAVYDKYYKGVDFLKAFSPWF